MERMKSQWARVLHPWARISVVSSRKDRLGSGVECPHAKRAGAKSRKEVDKSEESRERREKREGSREG